MVALREDPFLPPGVRVVEQEKEFDYFVKTAETEVETVLRNLDTGSIQHAADLIQAARQSGNRLHISGIGKPAHIAGYAASLFSSTGTPAYFLHGTEAVHGSCGQLVEGDVVIFISNSGETSEMKATVTAIRNNGCKVIGVTGNPESWLARNSDVHITVAVREEGGPLNRAPRMSIIAETLVLQALSIKLQLKQNIDPLQYIRWHPGGKLGELREDEKGIIRT